MAKQVKSKDGKTIFKRIVPDDTHKICSIFPKEVFLEESVRVPSCLEKDNPNQIGMVDGVVYSFVEVHPKRSAKFIGGGMNDTWEVTQDVSSYDHARDLIGYAFSDESDDPSPTDRSRDLEGRGLFVPKGATPTLLEIQAAKEKQTAYFEAVVNKAQNYWAQNRKMNDINELSLIAARAVGGKYEWASGEQRLSEKTPEEKLADALKLLIPAIQNQGAAPAAPAQRK